eukprot:5987011-Prymnesium_polylepis.1
MPTHAQAHDAHPRAQAYAHVPTRPLVLSACAKRSPNAHMSLVPSACAATARTSTLRPVPCPAPLPFGRAAAAAPLRAALLAQIRQ